MRGQEDASVHKVLALNHNFLTTCILLLLVVSVHCSGSGVPPVTSHGSGVWFFLAELSLIFSRFA